MKIYMKSPRTGAINMMDLPVTREQIEELNSAGRRLIQDIFPNLTDEQREFLLTGYTPEDWEMMFGKPEE